MSSKVSFFKRKFPELGSEFQAILNSGFITTGQISSEVEQLICETIKSDNCILTNSWTNGAICFLRALGIQPGDEVIVPAMTFCATANIVKAFGAVPILCDVDLSDGNTSISNIKKKVSPKTKLVILVHMYGKMVDVKPIAEFCETNGIFLIEDAAHAFESTRAGIHPGEITDGAIFSFYATKNITCGEGGAIVTKHAWLAEEIRKLTLHGMSANARDRYTSLTYSHYDVVNPGYKANLPDLLSFILRPQLETLEFVKNKRTDLYLMYYKKFEHLGSLDYLYNTHLPPDSHHAHHLFPIKVPEPHRDKFAAILNSYGIPVAVNFRSLTQLTAYSDQSCPNAEVLGNMNLSIPFYPGIAEEDIEHIFHALQIAIKEISGEHV